MTRKTLLSFPPPRHPDEPEPVGEIYYYSIWTDVQLWDPEALEEGEQS